MSKPPTGALGTTVQKRLVVAAVLVDDDLVLAARRVSPAWCAGLWEFPGGKLEPGESPHEALVREIREELATEIAIGPEVVGETPTWPISDALELRIFLARISGAPPRVVAEHDELRWMPLDALQDLPWLDSDRQALTAVREAVSAWRRSTGA